MDDYIKRDDALRELCFDCNCANECNRQRDRCYDYTRILLIPAADTIEVVRCKNCKHYDIPYCCCDDIPVHGGDATSFIPPPDFFCAYGERKQNERFD